MRFYYAHDIVLLSQINLSFCVKEKKEMKKTLVKLSLTMGYATLALAAALALVTPVTALA